MVAGIGAERIPGDLRVVVAVIVDKARRDDEPVGIDRTARGAGQLADLDDLPVFHRDVAAEGRATRAVDNAAVLDQQVIGHLGLLEFPLSRTAGEGGTHRAAMGG